MCDFVSWIEYKDDVYFLTNDCLKTKEGKELKKYLTVSVTHTDQDVAPGFRRAIRANNKAVHGRKKRRNQKKGVEEYDCTQKNFPSPSCWIPTRFYARRINDCCFDHSRYFGIYCFAEFV